MSNRDFNTVPQQAPEEAYYRQQPQHLASSEEHYRRPPPQQQRRRWGMILLVVGLVWLLLSIFNPLSASFFEHTSSIESTLRGEKLVLTLLSEDVTIGRSDDDQIHISGVSQGFGWNDDAAQRSLQDMGLNINQSGSTIEVDLQQPRSSFGFGRSSYIDLRVQVPASTDLTINTLSGDVRASETSGHLTIDTQSGDITLDQHEGPLTLNTLNGDVELNNGRATPVHVTTTSGDLKLDGVSGQITVETFSGEITIEQASDAALNVQTKSGDFTFQGSLGNAGSTTINSFSGSVRLDLPDNSAFRLNASTFSGSLDSAFDLANEQRQSGSLSGTVGANGPDLNITTTSGDVRLNKN